MVDWTYDAWPSGEPYGWRDARRGETGTENMDFHVDLGCGTAKKGRIGVDQFPGEGVDYILDLEGGYLPFPDDTIESMISHHCLEHIAGLPHLLDECWRVLKDDAPFRVIVPLFPSHAALADMDHKRLFVEDTFEHSFHVYEDAHFASPYMQVKWKVEEKDLSPPTPVHKMFTPEDAREMRVTLRPRK